MFRERTYYETGTEMKTRYEWRRVRRHQVRNRFGKEAMAASVSGGIEDFP